jgi:hypothetical protein
MKMGEDPSEQPTSMRVQQYEEMKDEKPVILAHSPIGDPHFINGIFRVIKRFGKESDGPTKQVYLVEILGQGRVVLKFYTSDELNAYKEELINNLNLFNSPYVV